jgi:microcystin-dependent protein
MALIAGVQYGTPITSTTYTGIPAGTILPCGNNAALTRTLLCDGSAVSRTTYAALFDAIGTAFGYGDNINTFNLPDFRGRFLRGVDGATTRDPDRASRTAMNTGGNTGDNVGSIQGHQYQSHTHTVNATTNLAGGAQGKVAWGNDTPSASNVMNASGGNETRPLNAYVNYCIAY